MIRVDRQALAALHEREAARFLAMHARSAALAAEDAQHFLFGMERQIVTALRPRTASTTTGELVMNRTRPA